MKSETPYSKSKRRRRDGPFSDNLKRVLEERGISMRGASELAGVSPSVVSSWLTGGMPHDVLAVQKLAVALKVNFEWLLTGKVTQVATKELSLSELFEERDTGLSGIFKISATRLIRKSHD